MRAGNEPATVGASQEVSRLLAEAYRRYESFWVNLARGIRLSEEDARDVVHTVLSSILGRPEAAFNSLEHVRNYVARAVVNRSLQARSRGERTAKWNAVLESTLEDPTVSSATEEAEFAQALVIVLRDLPPRSFQIVKLRFFSGYTFHQISALLNISVSTLKSREDAALRMIRTRLRTLGF